MGTLVHVKPLPGVILSAILFGFQLEAQAQGNLVNLCDWSTETKDSASPESRGFRWETQQANLVNLFDWSNETKYSGSPQFNVQVASSNSANFFGSESTNNSPCPFALPVLSGSIDTTPGETYDVSFIMQNDFVEDIGEPDVSIGDFTTNFDLPPAEQSPGQTQYFPVDISFTYVATSSMTDFTFEIPLDDGDSVSLEDLSVTEVPESSTAVILGTLGCAWLFARRWRSGFKARVSRLGGGPHL